MDLPKEKLLLASGAALGAYAGLRVLGSRLRESMLRKETVVGEVQHLGRARPAGEKLKGTAVVCGGSIAGLVTARILHDHYERVVVVEPEAWLATEDARRVRAWEQEHKRARLIQYGAIHVVHGIGYRAFRQLFDKFDEECAASGIAIGPADYKTHMWGNALADTDANDPTVFTSRQGIETLLRRLVLDKGAFPNIDYVVGTVTGLVASAEDPARVGGVAVTGPDGASTIDGAFFVDCTGSAQALKWLPAAGFGQVDPSVKHRKNAPLSLEELKIAFDPKTRYATMEFPLPPDLLKRSPVPDDGRNTIYCCLSHPTKNKESLYVLKRDGNIVQLCVGRWGGGETPSNLDEFIDLAPKMYTDNGHPDWLFPLLDSLHEVEDQMKLHKAVVPPRSWIRYHLASNLPSNWVALGDSVMTLTPAYGQGVVKAVMGAACLNELLLGVRDRVPDGFSKKFFEYQTDKIAPLWDQNRQADYAKETTVPVPGEDRSYGAFERWYGFRFQRLTFRDPSVTATFYSIMNMVAPGIDALQPSILAKVLWDVIRYPNAN
ncbi:hypothetical protein HDZ31DRAFT_33158 [Schizophyllum fasciatum]